MHQMPIVQCPNNPGAPTVSKAVAGGNPEGIHSGVAASCWDVIQRQQSRGCPLTRWGEEHGDAGAGRDDQPESWNDLSSENGAGGGGMPLFPLPLAWTPPWPFVIALFPPGWLPRGPVVGGGAGAESPCPPIPGSE